MNIYRVKTALISLIVVSLLSACSGGGSSGASASTAALPPVTTSSANISVDFVIPSAKTAAIQTQSSQTNLQYISSATKSASVDALVNDVVVAHGTADCLTTCAVTLAVPVGNVSLRVSMFDAAGGTGNVLSTNTSTVAIAQGSANAVHLTLGGVIASETVSFSGGALLAGTSGVINGVVTAKDAAGNTIWGSDPFSSPIQLQITGDAAGAWSLNTTSLTSPVSNTFTLTYNGNVALETPSLSVTGAGAAQVTPLPIVAASSVGLNQETAVSADAFVDSIGVAVHLAFPDTAYGYNYPGFKAALLASGIRHIRDGLNENAASIAHMNDLGQSGIRAVLVAPITMTSAQIAEYPSLIPGVIEGIEGPNEWDANGGPTWVATLTSFQKMLYTTLKSNPSTANIPVLGPSMAQAYSYHLLGNIQNYLDIGNLHNYFGGHNPGSTGWGSGGYGSAYGAIKYMLGAVGETSGSKPVITTETGYCAQGETDPVTSGRYFPRMYMEQFKAGILKTFTYEFLDNGGGCDGAFGLMTSNLVPRPGYTAVSGLIHALADPTGSFTPQALNYGLSTKLANLHHELFQKKNGTFVLALWNEIQSNPGPTSPAPNPTVTLPVTIASQYAAQSVSAQTFDDTGTLQNVPVTTAGSQMSVNVGDSITLVTLKF